MHVRQLPELAGNIVRHQRCLNELSSKDAQWAIQNTEDALNLFVRAVEGRDDEIVKKKLLQVVDDTMLTSELEEFEARKHFSKLFSSYDMRHFGSSQSETFMDVFGDKKAVYVSPVKLTAYSLNQEANEIQIISELGENYESSITDLYCVLRRELSGDKVLPTKKSSVFFVRDSKGRLWAVEICYVVDPDYGIPLGWRIYVYSVLYRRCCWSEGSRIFARAPSE